MADQDLTEAYKGLWQSTLGNDLIRSLQDLHASLITDAEAANSLEKGYGLLKEASGVMLAISHLKGKGTFILPKARRNGEVNNE